MNDCTHTLDYQLIDEGQKTTKEGQLKRTYDFLSCGCMDQHVKRVQHISSGQPMRKGRTGRVTTQNRELIKSTLVVIFRFNEAISCSWYLEEENTTDLEDYRKGY